LCAQEKSKKEYEQKLLLAGVFAGLLFAGLILVLQNHSEFTQTLHVNFPINKYIFQNPKFTIDGILTGLGFSIALFVLASLMMVDLASGEKTDKNKCYISITNFLFDLAIGFFLLSIDFLIWVAGSFWVAFFLFSFEILTLFVWTPLSKRGKWEKRVIFIVALILIIALITYIVCV
jgi:hypothetical protein